MAEVSPINTKDLLCNIRNRYIKDLIFTNVGETLIIVNPYRIIEGLYTEEKMKYIINQCNENSIDRYLRVEPHCFDTTMHCIYDLINTKKNQALVISGESGAGKTECAKLCMKFIAFYFGKKSEDGKEKEESLEDKILGCNPVLEAFGNAKTVRNDNSSRFGKYIKIFIRVSTKQIIGAYMETYLLEKSRVVSLAPGERNYHIFYQVLVGINELIKVKFDYEKLFTSLEEKGLILGEKTKSFIKGNLTEEKIKDLYNMSSLTEIKYENFNYLKNNVYTVPTIDDVFNFFECLEGMSKAGFSNEESNYVIRIVMAILYIGNIDFKEGEPCTITEETKPIQKKACDILNIDMNIFGDAFLFNVRIIKGETLKTPMSKKDCCSFRDTFSKEIYNRLFSFLVKRMNLTLFDENVRSQAEGDEDVQHIGLLDIFGFECFHENSFEQFCINYANEKLQNLYIEDIFKEIENMFKREGLEEHYSSIEFKDNTVILDAMGKYPTGIFYLLDNECNVAQKDNNVLNKVISLSKTNIALRTSLKNKDKFFICHTAKDVEYNITNFCVKNLDEFKLRMKDSVESIKDKIIQDMIGEGGDERHKKEKYLGGKFRSDMDNLAKALGECVRHYIRCLKPNEAKKKNFFVPWFSLLQIKYMGILDTIRVRQEGYPVIKTYFEYYMKYEDVIEFSGKPFYKEVRDDNPNLQEWCKLISKKLVPENSGDGILFGKSLILMRQKMSDKFDKSRRELLVNKERVVTLIAHKFRGMIPLRNFRLFYGAISTLQQNYKLFEYINKMNKVREIVNELQKKYKVIKIKEENKKFMKKMDRLQRFFLTNNVKMNNSKAYNKLLQSKYIITNYVKNFRQKKYLKYKALVRKIIEKIAEKTIKSDITPSIIMIQKWVRGHLSRVSLGELYNNIVKRRACIKEEIQCKKIQKHFRKHFYVLQIIKKQIAIDKFIGLIQYHKFHQWYVDVRPKVILIQRAYRRIYFKRKIIEERLSEFTEGEDMRYEDSTYVNSLTLFPDRQMESNPNEKGSQATIQKQKKLKKFYDKKLKALNPTKLAQASYLNHSPYDEPKLHFFAHLLDLDCIINIDDVYTAVPWCETYDEVTSHNIKQNTPIQLIEIGEFHTTLVNSMGKTFTWGWDGNGQCAFNISKDKGFLYDGFKRISDEENGNCLKGNIDEMNYEGGVDMDIDFDNEIENIKNEKAIFEDENEIQEEEEEFDEEKFNEFYYLDSPIIIDNFNVKKIACGQDNTMILTKDEKLFVFGANNYYQLGVLKTRNIYSPMSFNNIVKTQQENPAVNIKSNIKSMKFSGKNAVLLNDSGNLIILSCFCSGATGIDALYRTPIELPITDVKFAEVECGKDFCLLLAENGHLYSFGMNEFGQLGHGDTEQRAFPTIVQFFLSKKIKVQQISCGFKHSAAKANNKVYTWGCNNCGQLGKGNLENFYTPELNDIKYSKIKANFLQVSCGFRSTVFLTETRQLFWCGTNGDIQQQTVPIEFLYNLKVPELFTYENYVIVKINHSWSKTMSILYATVAETGPLKYKLNNPKKLDQILLNLTLKWTSKDLYSPRSEGLDNYIAEKHLIEENKPKNKNKKKKK